MAPKTLFKASGGFYNIRALHRTLNQGHRRRRKKYTQGKMTFFQTLPPTGESFDPDFSYY